MADFREMREIYDDKVKPLVEKTDAALDEMAAKVERHQLTKWILVALALASLIAVGAVLL